MSGREAGGGLSGQEELSVHSLTMMRTLLPVVLGLSLSGSVAVWAQEFEKAEFTASSGDAIRYALLSPDTVKKGETYPLVITLHGIGGRGVTNWVPRCYANDVLATPAMRKDYPCFVVAPTTDKGETWWSSGGLRGKERLPDVFDLITNLVQEMPIDASRIYVTGQSMGGFGTFGAVGQRPDLFAAAAPVCGGYDAELAKKFADLPIWVFHGAKDKIVPTERSRDMVKVLKKAGGDPKYTEFPGVGHNAWTPAYDDPELWKWLFAQKK